MIVVITSNLSLEINGVHKRLTLYVNVNIPDVNLQLNNDKKYLDD